MKRKTLLQQVVQENTNRSLNNKKEAVSKNLKWSQKLDIKLLGPLHKKYLTILQVKICNKLFILKSSVFLLPLISH